MLMSQWLEKKALSTERLREYTKNAKECNWVRPKVRITPYMRLRPEHELNTGQDKINE